MSRVAPQSVWLALVLATALATSAARAQEPEPEPPREHGSVFWEDPTLEDAVKGVDLIVLGQVVAVDADGATWKVEKTLFGPDRSGAELTVSGLHHPDLRPSPPVEKGDRAYLLLLGDAQGKSLHVPTPSFGRFPIKTFGPRQMAIASLGDTFTRLPMEPARFEQLLVALRGGPHDELLAQARSELEREELDPAAAYAALRLVVYFGQAEDAPRVLRLLQREDLAPDERWVVRMAAAAALGRTGTPPAVARLLELVRADKVPAVRSAAARALSPALAQVEDPTRRREAADALALLAAEADAEPVQPLDLEDPRRNEIDSPLMACLRTLASVDWAAGVRPALRALERNDLGAVVAGLTFFEVLGERAYAGEIARRMRAPGAEDELVNRIFARTLEALTGQSLGTERARWLKWWEGQPPQQPEAPR